MDPDDPWFAENLVKSHTVNKAKCASCGTLYTLPFEKTCPLCKFKPGRVHPPYFKLDVEGIKRRATGNAQTES